MCSMRLISLYLTHKPRFRAQNYLFSPQNCPFSGVFDEILETDFWVIFQKFSVKKYVFWTFYGLSNTLVKQNYQKSWSRIDFKILLKTPENGQFWG